MALNNRPFATAPCLDWRRVKYIDLDNARPDGLERSIPLAFHQSFRALLRWARMLGRLKKWLGENETVDKTSCSRCIIILTWGKPPSPTSHHRIVTTEGFLLPRPSSTSTISILLSSPQISVAFFSIVSVISSLLSYFGPHQIGAWPWVLELKSNGIVKLTAKSDSLQLS